MNEEGSSPVTAAANTQAQAEVLLQAQSLTKTFQEGQHQVKVLTDVNLTIKRGDMIAVCGASGCGKSTLLHLLGGLDKPSSGHIYLMGQDIWRLSESARCSQRNARLGFVYQFHHLLPEFNALENVMMPLLIAGLSRKIARERAAAILLKVSLQDRMQHRIGEMSGGERQRVAIARALVTDPDCVLADEPTGNLDPKAASRVFDLMLSLNQELATSFVMVTHNAELAEKMKQQWYLEDGRLAIS